MSRAPHSAGILHLLLGSEKVLWRDCLRHCQATDTVVLLDGAVMGLTRLEEGMIDDFPCPVHVSGPDIDARLGANFCESRQLSRISDAELVTLIESHQHCMSWR